MEFHTTIFFVVAFFLSRTTYSLTGVYVGLHNIYIYTVIIWTPSRQGEVQTGSYFQVGGVWYNRTLSENTAVFLVSLLIAVIGD